jgi:predicted AlkP superfamily phosphohydrolase/phosphomutase
MSARVFLLGIDGGSWKVLEPLAEAGWMPHLGKLIARGKKGTLLSTIPPITCPAWLSLASGLNPGWLGVFGFTNLKPGSYDLSYYDYHRDPEVPEIWDILGERGCTCGVINVPVIRNPRPINGYMVPGFLADDRDFNTYPKDIKERLDKSADGYQIELRGFSIMEPEKTVSKAERILVKRFQAMNALLEERPTDVFLGVFHLPDRVCHAVLNRTGLPLDPEQDELSASTASFFKSLDRYLGELVNRFVDDGDLLILLSDHGFAPCLRGLNLNSWLMREGYLEIGNLPGLFRLGISQRRVAVALDKVGFLKPAMRLTPKFLRRRVPAGTEKGAQLSIVDVLQAGGVDWARTAAIALPNHGIYINTSDRPQGILDKEGERGTLIEEIKRKLLELQDPDTGERPVVSVLTREEIYRGPRLLNAPDLMVEVKEGWTTKASIKPGGELIEKVRRADHRREGIYVVAGPGVQAEEAGDARIEDIAPTVLSFMGIEPPTSMDGRSLV